MNLNKKALAISIAVVAAIIVVVATTVLSDWFWAVWVLAFIGWCVYWAVDGAPPSNS